eukprot:scaffold200518_cov28-Tisochrysis_lutea.AAC.4
MGEARHILVEEVAREPGARIAARERAEGGEFAQTVGVCQVRGCARRPHLGGWRRWTIAACGRVAGPRGGGCQVAQQDGGRTAESILGAQPVRGVEPRARKLLRRMRRIS